MDCRTCTDCKISKDVSNFKLLTHKKENRTYLRGRCHNCWKLVVKQNNAHRKDAKKCWDKPRRAVRYARDKANGKKKLSYKKDYARNRQKYIDRANKRQWKRTEQKIALIYKKEIQTFYIESRRSSLESKIKHNVDHIVPLNHEKICGLDVPWNLQILLESQNKQKNNKFDFTVENLGWFNEP